MNERAAAVSDNSRRTHTWAAGWVTSVALVEGGEWAVSGSYDRTVKLWDVAHRKHKHTFSDHTGSVTKVVAHGTMVASASNDMTVNLFDIRARKKVRTITHKHPVSALVFSDDGSLVVSGTHDGTLEAHATKNGKRAAEFEGHGNEIRDLCLRDGVLASASSDKTCRTWGLDDGTRTKPVGWKTGGLGGGVDLASGMDADVE